VLRNGDVSAHCRERFDLGVGEKAAVSSEFLKLVAKACQNGHALDDFLINWGRVDTSGRSMTSH